MILRSLSHPDEKTADLSSVQPAWKVFIETQKHIRPPYAIIFQSEHSKLAGRLAEALSPDAFGELPPEVVRAVREHDFGWDGSDKNQVKSLGQIIPRPFPSMTAEETLPSWRASLAHAQFVALLVDVLVSRHLSLLGRGDPDRAEFVRSETERRAAIERILPCAPADLDRWTGALGFCDLLSLYLCSGAQIPVEFPMAHPADPAAARAPKAVLCFQGGSPRFLSQVLKSDAPVSLAAQSYNGSGAELRPLTLEWRFA